MTLEELDKKMEAKFKKLRKKNLHYGMQWLHESSVIFDWYEANLKKHGL